MKKKDNYGKKKIINVIPLAYEALQIIKSSIHIVGYNQPTSSTDYTQEFSMSVPCQINNTAQREKM